MLRSHQNTHLSSICAVAQVLSLDKSYSVAVQVLSGKFAAPHLLPANGASCQFIPNHGRDNHHCMSLPVVKEGETSDNPTQSIHNIVMTTEEAVNEVLIRQRFIR